MVGNHAAFGELTLVSASARLTCLPPEKVPDAA
jgi:hypothetical protein